MNSDVFVCAPCILLNVHIEICANGWVDGTLHSSSIYHVGNLVSGGGSSIKRFTEHCHAKSGIYLRS